MERGIEQLFLLAVVLAAALIDLIVRGVRRMGRASSPSETAADAAPREGAAGRAPPDEEGWPFPEGGGVRQEPVGGAAPGLGVASPVDTAPARRAAAPSVAVPAAFRRARLEAPRRSRRSRLPVLASGAVGLREAIVVMAILGPCRAIDPPRGEFP